ncbi:GNAT family N-acetyltransferase [Sandarakinorhabdus limnophila]|uniref:GNAT family N-acetyltransferase n=1 Tax=Sandarakinorhabdus limnophila TaxID=210512 RepID=UPI0026EF5029|nr:GNAT family N-acetyltransferase [Sandarakinorhabdus limnophila]
MIRLARPTDLPLLPAIEASAATLFAGTAKAHVVDGPTTPAKALVAGLEAHSLWVAAAPQPCGFLLTAATAGWLHIQQLSVARDAQGRGLGAALLQAAIAAAPALHCGRLSLTTDRWLAWNAPFYARHGFAEVAAHDPALPEWLAGLPAHAATGGLDPARRCIMVRSA